MEFTITAFGVLCGLEQLLWTPLMWRFHKVCSVALMILLAILSVVMLIIQPHVFIIVLTIFSLYRLVNLLRIAKDRVQADYLYGTTSRTSVTLIALQLGVLAVADLSGHLAISSVQWLYSLAGFQLIIATITFYSTVRNLKSIRPPVQLAATANQDLPSLTVALPARNETTDLEACLQSLISSSYPKLEILVLDDCSQNKRTPEIIRDFAHAGVRFIAGKTPPNHWLAKNYAYQQLSEEASGELLLFCGVDTRFEVDSLKAMVEVLLQEKRSMLSVLPRNLLPTKHGLLATIIQPSRYAWELALPRFLVNRPPVLSTCWLIQRSLLDASGGFKAIERGHSPESYFARAANQQPNGYRFIKSSSAVGLTSAKSSLEQCTTAIRTRYPQLHRRPEVVGLTAVAELTILVGPLILLIGSLLTQTWTLASLSLLSCLLFSFSYSRIVTTTYRQSLQRGFWLLPLVACYDAALLNYSMWQYEFNEVLWKGRNVCIPIMRVEPKLPAPTTSS
jgi:hypothetical protein